MSLERCPIPFILTSALNGDDNLQRRTVFPLKLTYILPTPSPSNGWHIIPPKFSKYVKGNEGWNLIVKISEMIIRQCTTLTNKKKTKRCTEQKTLMK